MTTYSPDCDLPIIRVIVMRRILASVGIVLCAAVGAPRASAQRPESPESKRIEQPLGHPGRGSIDALVLDANETPLPHVSIRLRDARTGGEAARHDTDASGRYVFAAIEPGSYVVEIVGEDGRALAASNVVHLNRDDISFVVVRLAQSRQVPALLPVRTSTALAIVGAAAAAGVLASRAGNPVSPRQ